MVLQLVKIFNQQVTARRFSPKQSLDVGKGGRVDKPSLWLVTAATSAGFASLLSV